ncbi:50S ribosomal protein L3 N(5)-glutamine methyltransferase [Diaphorobacter sp.]|uniref:50S ribosomal protein L3 N(5)-glutamine methyltransferase n=1 Tax=Diaphorobacter sp. TaxID=1934310 RepID=UPI0028AB3B10|nr:50S ribosomal protein L3 N(5)-glutamine methyltransferase [Diaphorobacter sp.]
MSASTITLGQLVRDSAAQLESAGVAFGHGTATAYDEAAWLVLWQLGLPLDTSLDAQAEDTMDGRAVSTQELAKVRQLIAQRINTRKPAAYLTREAWLQGVPFYVDERAIVPRSFIAELLADGTIDEWLSEETRTVLDLCTGNGSLACLAAMTYPEVVITASDISSDALAVARINVDKHHLADRITLVQSDGMGMLNGTWDLVLCNPPYVNADSMGKLPEEYRAEPALALAGGADGMDFIRTLFAELPERMSADGVLVLEIGNEKPYFDAAFPSLPVFWLDTSSGDEQVLLVTRAALLGLRG